MDAEKRFQSDSVEQHQKNDNEVLRSLQTGCPDNGLAEPDPKLVFASSEPGTLAANVLRFVYPRKTFEKVFKETILDFRQEVKECRLLKQPWRARWMTVVYHFILANTVIEHTSANTLGKMYRSVFGASNTNSDAKD